MRASSEPLHICIRKTADWGDQAAFWAQLDPGFAPKVQAWNSTFRLPYHEFRRELRAIAQANLAKVQGAVLCTWEEVPEGALVAPVDDDDGLPPPWRRPSGRPPPPMWRGFTGGRACWRCRSTRATASACGSGVSFRP